MKKLLLVALGLLAVGEANAQLVINCVQFSLTPCNPNTNPGNGAQGDPAWLAFGKINSNFTTLFGGVTKLTSTGGTIALTPSSGNGGTVDLETIGTPIASLPATNGLSPLLTDPLAFEYYNSQTTEQVEIGILLGLSAEKPAVNAVATTAVSSLSGAQTIDSATLTAGMRVLLTANGVQNGVWVVQTGAWTRPLDYYSNATGGGSATSASSTQVYYGASVFVLGGSHAGYTYYLSSPAYGSAITVDTTSTTWSGVAGGGGGGGGTPGGSDGSVQYNKTGTLYGDSTIKWDYVNQILTIGQYGSSNPTITPAATTGSNNPLGLSLLGASGGPTLGAGGGVTITGGSSQGTSGAGGSVSIQAGSNGSTGTGAGGSVTINAGSSLGSQGAGGLISIRAGNSIGTAASGSVTIAAGTAQGTSGAGSNVTITAGTPASSSTSAAGSVKLNGGASASQTGNGGSILVAPTASAGTYANQGIFGVGSANGTGYSLEVDGYGNAIEQQGKSFGTPQIITSGSSATVSNLSGYFIVSRVLFTTGAGSTFTLTTPSTPIEGQELYVHGNVAVTLTLTGGGSQAVSGGSVSLSGTNGFAWVYESSIGSAGTWIRLY